MGFLKKISIFWIVVLAFLFFAGVMHIVDAIDGNKQPLLSTVLSATRALAVGIDTAVSRLRSPKRTEEEEKEFARTVIERADEWKEMVQDERER